MDICSLQNQPGPLQQDLFPAVGGITGIVVGFAIAFVLIFAWHFFRAPHRQRDDTTILVETIQRKHDAALDAVRFALAFDSLVFALERETREPPSRVGIGISFQNTSKELIQYNLIRFRVELDNKTVDNPTFFNTHVHVQAGRTSDYLYPDIKGIDMNKCSTGTLEYEVNYSSVPAKRWYVSRRKMAIQLVMPQEQLVWRVLEDYEAPIDEPSTPIAPLHQEETPGGIGA